MTDQYEREACPVSHAAAVTEIINAAAVNAERERVARALAPEQDPDNIDPYCVDCGGEIGEGRLAMLRCRCVHCQDAKEKLENQYGRR